jgi:glycosyltransferase involved in cell wall biosynthesis
LSVIHGQCTKSERSKNDEANLEFAKVRSNKYLNVFGTILCFLKLDLDDIRDADLVVIPQENSFLINYIILLFRVYLGIKNLAFWGHGRNFQAKSNSSLSEKFKNNLLFKVNWWFCYTSISKKTVLQSGFDEMSVTDLQNAIDTNSLKLELKSITEQDKKEFLECFNIKGKELLLYLGSMYSEKEIPFLISSLKEIKAVKPDVEILWVGSGPDQKLVEEFCQSVDWSFYAGSLHGKDKALALSVSKLILNPGLVGLGILDSFSSKKPMVSSFCGNHSPEVAYLKNGINGIMTEKTVEEYAKSVANLLINETLYNRLSEGCRESATVYTVENMSKNFQEGLLKAIEIRTAK